MRDLWWSLKRVRGRASYSASIRSSPICATSWPPRDAAARAGSARDLVLACAARWGGPAGRMAALCPGTEDGGSGEAHRRHGHRMAEGVMTFERPGVLMFAVVPLLWAIWEWRS